MQRRESSISYQVRPYIHILTRRARLAKESLNRASTILKSTYQETDRAVLPLDYQWKKIIDASQDILNNLPLENGKKVLFAQGYGFSPTTIALESTFAMALRLRGITPIVQICNHVLPACEFNPFGNFRPDPGKFGPHIHPIDRNEICSDCTKPLNRVYDQLPVIKKRFSDYLRPDDHRRFAKIAEEAGRSFKDCQFFVYRDIPVGEQARATTLRNQLRSTLEENEYTTWLLSRYLLAGVYVAELSHRLFEELNLDAVVMTHGIYITHGIISAVASKLGVPVVVYGGLSYRKGTVILAPGETYHRQLLSEPNTVWKQLELNEDQNKLLDKYLDSKRSGSLDRVSYHPNPIEDREILIRELDLDPSKKTVSLFTNVIWDAQIYYTQNAFSSLMDWLFRTIEYFSQRNDVQLVVRVHPGEVKGGNPTNQRVPDEIRAKFGDLPPNIKVIPPESDLSSYTLADLSCAALIYGTKLAIELATKQIPVVIAGEAFSRGKGFTYDVSSEEEYFALLDRITDLPPNTSAMIAEARKYAYHFYFRRMVDFPLFHVDDPFTSRGLKLQFNSLSDLVEGKYPSLDLICDGILNGTPFIYDAPSSK